MTCKTCGIEMTRVKGNEWACRNPKCMQYPANKKKEKN